MTNHARSEELIAAYALDALDGGQAVEAGRDLLDHLTWCGSCPRLYTELRETAAALALAIPASPVTLAFHERVMGAVRAESRPTVSSQHRPGHARRALLVASVSLVFGLGGLNVSLSGRLHETRIESQRSEAALAFVNHPITQLVGLSGARGLGRMAVAVRPDGRAVLMGSGLRLQGGRVFEIWRQQGSRLVPVATFVPVDGRALVGLRVDPGVDTGVAVTIERERVEHPTTALVFQGSLPA